jgi:hypothetical protein
MIRAVITILLVVATVPARAALNPQDNVSAAEITADNFPPTATGTDLVPRLDAYRPHWLNGMGLICVRRSTLFVCRK